MVGGEINMSEVMRRSRTGWRAAMAVLAVAVLLGSSTVANAQAVRGGLVGNIVDQAGLALPGATVTITETNTNISSTTTTNESGYYTFQILKDSTYKQVAELQVLQQ